jgi:hypothetical protein
MATKDAACSRCYWLARCSRGLCGCDRYKSHYHAAPKFQGWNKSREKKAKRSEKEKAQA